MATSDEIDITGLDPVEVVVALCNASGLPPGLEGMRGVLADDPDARAAIVAALAGSRRASPAYGDAPAYEYVLFDYVEERPVKVGVRFYAARAALTGAAYFDRDAGEGACARVVAAFRARAAEAARVAAMTPEERRRALALMGDSITTG